MTSITLNNVGKKFGDFEAIPSVDLEVEPGEFVALVGPSGCGKSTLLRIMCGLEDCTSGDVLIDGQSMRGIPPGQRGVAMVFQSYALYPHMNVAQNMGFALRMMDVDEDELEQRVNAAAEILQLGELLERKPGQLSGGQRQRVAIGRAIVRKPKVFLFDEPLSNLDASLRSSMRLQLAKLHQELNTTMVYVTHDQVEAMTLADRIVVLNEGIVQQIGKPLELYHHPENMFVASFIGSPKMNLIAAQAKLAKGGAIKATSKDLQGLTIEKPEKSISSDEKLTIGIRPEGFSSTLTGGPHISGQVEFVENLGNMSYVSLRLPSSTTITIAAPGDYLASPGETAKFEILAQHVHVFDSEGKAITTAASSQR